MAETKVIQRYVGFYLVEGLWPESRPDLSFVKSHNWVISRQKYWQMMEKVVFEYSNGNSRIVVFGDGMIAFTDPELSKEGDNDKFFERIERYSEILNALYLIFVSEITKHTKIKFHTHFEVTHQDIVPLTYENGKQVSMGLPQKTLSSKQLDYRHLSDVPSGYVDNIADWVDRFNHRPVVPKDVLESACKQFFAIGQDKPSIRMLARANKAVSEFASASFSNSIIASWIQVEVYLFRKLDNFMKAQGSTRFPKKRRESLLDQSSAQVIEFLEVTGQLNKDMYDSLTKVRKVRNKIIHTDYSATLQEASDSLILFEKVIEDVSSEKVMINSGISMGLF